MPNTKISDLTAVTDVLGTDEYVLARSGQTRKIDASDFADGLAGLGVGTPVLYDSGYLGASAATFDSGAGGFSGSYFILKIFLYLRGTTGSEVLPFLRFNNDSSALYNYSYDGSFNGGDANAYVAGQTSCRIGAAPGSTQAANRFAVVSLQVAAYSGTANFKPFVGGCWESATGAVVFNLGGEWQSTSPVTRVQIIPDAGSWDVGSRMMILAEGPA